MSTDRILLRNKSTKILKPAYKAGSGAIMPPIDASIPLSVFDNVSFDTHVAVIYAFRPPTPDNETIIAGLATALSEYREWAGRLGKDEEGKPVILLNDAGVKVVQASADDPFHKIMPFKPSSVLLQLHPDLNDVEELVQVQLTQFACGSLAVGFTAHHLVADGQSTSNFIVAWGRAVRGLQIDPIPLHDRQVFFKPRNPPRVLYDHISLEFAVRNPCGKEDQLKNIKDDVIVHKAHFSKEFLSKLKLKASIDGGNNSGKPYSTFESLIAHLWRVITKARGLGAHETTEIRIAVDGRARLVPRVPNEYFGNLVLWAFPRSRVKELTSAPLSHAAKLIHNAVAEVNDEYFRSFIDFASSDIIKKDDLMPTSDPNTTVLCPSLEVDSWLRFPFYDLDFGGGCPFYFMPSYLPVEGLIILLPSYIGDGSIDAFIALFEHNLTAFRQGCYTINESN